MKVKEIVEQLIKNGCKEVKGLTIKNVTPRDLTTYTRLGITLESGVDFAKTDEETGEVSVVKNEIIFASTYSIAALMKEMEEAAFAANIIAENGVLCALILSRAKIDIVQQYVKAGNEYANPFSKEATPETYDTDKIMNHIVKITFSSFGIKQLDKIAESIINKALASND